MSEQLLANISAVDVSLPAGGEGSEFKPGEHSVTQVVFHHSNSPLSLNATHTDASVVYFVILQFPTLLKRTSYTGASYQPHAAHTQKNFTSLCSYCSASSMDRSVVKEL